MKIITLPGLIDLHVHLRDPGETHKEDFYTGTCAALSGGITTVFDMPNNINPIFSEKALDEKIGIAEKKAVCDWGLYFGTDGKNITEFEKVTDRVIGLKVYLTETTGKYFIEDSKLLDTVFQSWPNTKPIVVHAEGEKVDIALNLGMRYKKRVHITHISNVDTLTKILAAKKSGLDVTCDVTPHHLFLTQEYVEKNNRLGQVKPLLESQKAIDLLWEHLADIDCIATDHAPHTIDEKLSQSPPSGFPGLETVLPLLLTAVSEKRIMIDDIVRMMHINPMRIFGIRQSDNSYCEVDIEQEYSIGSSGYNSKSQWSPFEGKKVQGVVKKVYIRGNLVFSDGKILAAAGSGKMVSFSTIG